MTHKASHSDGLLSAKPPKPALAIGKEKVFVAIGIVGVLLACAVVSGNRSSTPKPNVETSRKVGNPAYSIVSLPSSYAELPPPTPRPH